MCTWKRLGRCIILSSVMLTQIVCFSMIMAKLQTYHSLEWYYVFVPQFVMDVLGACLLFIRLCQSCLSDECCCDTTSSTPSWGPGVVFSLFGLGLKIAGEVLLCLYVQELVAFFIPVTCLSVLCLFLFVVLLLYGMGLPQLCVHACSRW